MDISRRNLIKSTLAASAAAAAGLSLGCKKKEAAPTTAATETPAATTTAASASTVAVDKWVKGVCRMCGTGCSIYVGVKDGKMVAIKGNVDSKTNTKGFLCIKGMNIWKVAYHPDRLTTPLIRKNGKLEPATWDEALTLIETKFKEFHKKYGYDSVAYYGSGQCTTEESYTFNKIWKGGFGSNMMDGNPRLCMASAVAGYLSSFGSDEPAGAYEDIENAKCIFITGSNTSEAHPILFRRISSYKRQNPDVKIIVCEPRKTQTSKIADLWMPSLPGTDLAIFNGMAREIIKNDWHDKEFIARHARFTQGDGTEASTFDEYIKFIEKYTPEYVEKVTGCPAASVKQAAEWFAKSGATLSLWCMGLNQRSNGVWANNLIHNLHVITGNIGKPGADPFSLTGQPNACGGVRETGSLAHLLPGCRPVAVEPWRKYVESYWKVAEHSINPSKAINPKPGFPAVKLFSSLGGENEADKPVKAILISTTNPAQTLPNLNKFVPNIKNAFTVVIDIFPTRTAQLASVVLPASFLYEKGGVYGCSERRSFLTQKAIEPLEGTKADLWIACQIAKRMGLEKFIAWSNEEDIVKMAEMAWNDYIGCTANTEKTLAGATYKRLMESTTGVQWPCPSEDHPGTYKRYVRGMDPVFDDPKKYGYEIPEDADMFFYGRKDGKINVFMRDAEPKASEKISKEYPFLMTTGRVIEQWHTGTMTMRIPETAAAHPNSYIEIHVNDAKKLGLSQGDMVKVESVRGENVLPVRVVNMTLEGVCFVPMHDQKGARMVNFICSDVVDATSGEPDYKVSAVKITKVSGPQKVDDKFVVTKSELDSPTFS